MQAIANDDAYNGFGYTLLKTAVKVTPDRTRPQHLVSMAMIRSADGALATETQWQDTATAYECNYDACAKAYLGWRFVSGTVMPGKILESQLIATDVGRLIPFTTLERDFPGNTTFEINAYDLEVIAEALARIYDHGSPSSNKFTAGLYNSPNLTRTVGNIATGMSYQMLSGPNATTVIGEVFAVQSYMRTHWARLSLAATLEVFTIFFLLLVILATGSARQEAWKRGSRR